MLPNMEIRALLEDRAPLMTTRGAHSRQLLPDESALVRLNSKLGKVLAHFSSLLFLAFNMRSVGKPFLGLQRF